MKPIELLINANQGKLIQHKFSITAGKDKIELMLDYDSFIKINRDKDNAIESVLAEHRAEGRDRQSINEDRWKEHIQASIENRKRFLENKNKDLTDKLSEKEIKKQVDDFQKNLEKGKPKNLAEQLASERVDVVLLERSIPKFVKLPNGKMFCETIDELAAFRSIINADFVIATALINAYLELAQKITDELSGANEAAKNSLPQEN